jgi:hypothetical protein
MRIHRWIAWGLLLGLLFVAQVPTDAAAADEAHALALNAPQYTQTDGKVRGGDAIADLLGDPENWLGGENVRPKPNGADEEEPGTWTISLGAIWEQLLTIFVLRIGTI